MKKSSYLFLFLIFTLIFVGCSKDNIENAKKPEDTSKIIEVKDVQFQDNVITATYVNHSDVTYVYGNKVTIFKLENNEWKEIKFERAYTDIEYSLKGKSEIKDEIFLVDINDKGLDKGIYRIRKEMNYEKIEYKDLKDSDYEHIDIIVEVK